MKRCIFVSYKFLTKKFNFGVSQCISGHVISQDMEFIGLAISQPFLAHLWCAYAMALCLSWIVRREVGCVCVEHNYPKMWMD